MELTDKQKLEFYKKLLAKLLKIKNNEMTLDFYINEVSEKVEKYSGSFIEFIPDSNRSCVKCGKSYKPNILNQMTICHECYDNLLT